MHPLGLSRGVLKDGFPVLLDLFDQPNITTAIWHRFNINPLKWPLKDGYPAIASIKAQIITYSINHFFVCVVSLYHPCMSSYLSVPFHLLIDMIYLSCVSDALLCVGEIPYIRCYSICSP